MKLNESSKINKISSLASFSSLCVLLSVTIFATGCDGFKAKTRVYNATEFTEISPDGKPKTDPPSKSAAPSTSIPDVAAQRTLPKFQFELDPLPSEGLKPLPELPEDSVNFAEDISKIKVAKIDSENGEFDLSVRWSKGSGSEKLTSVYLSSGSDGKVKAATSDANILATNVTCLSTECDSLGLLLERRSDGAVAQIKMTKRTEYLRGQDLKIIGRKSRVLQDAVDYHWPIQRFKLSIKEGASFDSLVITPPKVDDSSGVFADLEDEFSEDSAEPEGEPSADTEEDSEDRSAAEQGYEDRTLLVIDIDPQATLAEAPVSTSDPSANQDGKTEGESPTEETPEKLEVTEKPPVMIRSTPDIREAYNIELPDDLFKGLYVRDTSLLESSFKIKPVSQQEVYESSYRMDLFSNALIKAKVKIYRNACNIFVKTVMTLSGYTEVGKVEAVANKFYDRVFKPNRQGLADWDRHTFKYKGAIDLERTRLKQLIEDAPDNYAIIMRVDRSKRGQHGHIAFLVKRDGEVYVVDSSLDKRTKKGKVIHPGVPPGMKKVKDVGRLLKKSRPIVDILSERGLISGNHKRIAL